MPLKQRISTRPENWQALKNNPAMEKILQELREPDEKNYEKLVKLIRNKEYDRAFEFVHKIDGERKAAEKIETMIKNSSNKRT